MDYSHSNPNPVRDRFVPPLFRRSFALHSQYIYTWQTFGRVIGGGAVMVAVIIAILQGSLTVSLLMAISIVMVVLQVLPMTIRARSFARCCRPF